ncbi:MAG: hypothetical protein Q7W51_01220 [Coriobacteriia bacterium]|nr:hypothetical protein [Coriobacteriia bacterium]
MSETVPQPGDQETTERVSGSRVTAWLGAALLVVVVLVVFMHIFAPAIGSDEEPPPGHPQSACIACHLVTGSAGTE